MISVIAGFAVKDGKEAECLDIVKKLVEATQKENGCIMYECFKSTDDPKKFVIMEKWESKEALDAHMATAHFKEYVPVLDSLSAGGVSVSTYSGIM